MSDILDWTRGGRSLAYQLCGGCGAVRYFRRDFCPACGSEASETREASGQGTVYAVTTVVRAPSPEWKALAPYGIALVDAREGFRFMAHAEEGLRIGDAVSTSFREVGDALVPLVQADRTSR